jgi:hypothetical protein
MGVLRDFFYILAHWFLNEYVNFFHKRLKNQDKQIQNQDKQISLQINQRVDERFNSAITLLGSSETSARTGAVYALHEWRVFGLVCFV